MLNDLLGRDPAVRRAVRHVVRPHRIGMSARGDVAVPCEPAPQRGWATMPAPAPLIRGVVARIVTGPHDAHRQDPHLSRRYDIGRPRALTPLYVKTVVHAAKSAAWRAR